MKVTEDKGEPKYHHNAFKQTSLLLFITKLQETRQTEEQMNQAKLSISLFYQLQPDIQQYPIPESRAQHIQEPEKHKQYKNNTFEQRQNLLDNLPLDS